MPPIMFTAPNNTPQTNMITLVQLQLLELDRLLPSPPFFILF